MPFPRPSDHMAQGHFSAAFAAACLASSLWLKIAALSFLGGLSGGLRGFLESCQSGAAQLNGVRRDGLRFWFDRFLFTAADGTAYCVRDACVTLLTIRASSVWLWYFPCCLIYRKEGPSVKLRADFAREFLPCEKEMENIFLCRVRRDGQAHCKPAPFTQPARHRNSAIMGTDEGFGQSQSKSAPGL